MKRLMKLMVVVAIAIAPLLAGGPAAAQQATCEVGFTGPNSDNLCVSTTTYECTVENETDIVVRDENNQVVGTGTATSGGNTSGGNATTGSASNENGTNFVVVINNETEVCTASVVVPPTTVTPEAPVPTDTGGGQGAVEVLPETSSDPVLQAAAWATGALLLAAALSVGGVLWYRHNKA